MCLHWQTVETRGRKMGSKFEGGVAILGSELSTRGSDLDEHRRQRHQATPTCGVPSRLSQARPGAPCQTLGSQPIDAASGQKFWATLWILAPYSLDPRLGGSSALAKVGIGRVGAVARLCIGLARHVGQGG